MIRDRFQTRTVQDRTLTLWQTIDFASQRSESDTSDHDTLQTLCLKGKQIHRSLPTAYADDIHLRDFLLRVCASEPFASKIPEEPAKTSSDAQAQLSAAITRYAAHKARISRGRHAYTEKNQNTRDNRLPIHFAANFDADPDCEDTQGTHYVTKNSSLLQNRKENNLDRTGKQMLCHNCYSKYHLLSACPTASTEKKIHYLAHLETEEGVADPQSCDSNISKVCLASSWDELTTQQSEKYIQPDEEIHAVLMAHRGHDGPPILPVTSGFLGICIDTGAATSVSGRKQHEEYLKSVLIPSSVRTLSSSVKRFRFGATTVSSLGRAMIRMPCQVLNSTNHSESISFTFAMDIVNLDVPLLLGLDVIMACGATVDMSSMTLRSPSWTAHVELRDGHNFVPPTHGVILFSAQELRTLHRKL
jgi:hypothetical protein